MIKRKEGDIYSHLHKDMFTHVAHFYICTPMYMHECILCICMYAYSIIIHFQLKLITADSQGGSFWSVCWKFKTYLLKMQPGNLTRRATTLLMWVLPLFLFHKWADNSQINVKMNECSFQDLVTAQKEL